MMYNMLRKKKTTLMVMVVYPHDAWSFLGVFRERLKAAGLYHKLEQHQYASVPTTEVSSCHDDREGGRGRERCGGGRR